MALDATHPLYGSFAPDRELCEHAYEGERKVKDEGRKYLPATQAHILDGMATTNDIGYQNYFAYKTRAVFPDYVRECVEMSIGMMHQKDAVIELPPELEYLRENATSQGENLLQLLRRINENQLVSGRLGLLLDMSGEVVKGSYKQMYFSLYPGINCKNWNDDGGFQNGKLTFVSLDESSEEMDDEFNWNRIEKYRVLKLNNGVYQTGLFRETTAYIETSMITPKQVGVELNEIPFTFINTKDTSSVPDLPPLVGLARQCMTIYRTEADYRYNLFMQGQDTLVTIGDEASAKDGMPLQDTQGTRIGAGAKISMDVGGDAKFIGVTSEGLSEQRQAIENDRKLAATKTVQVGVSSGDAESGKSRKLRIAAETANLTQVALAGADGLTKLLKIAARWIKADETLIKVWPNLEFASVEIDGPNLLAIQTAKIAGAPISQRSIHGLLKEAGTTIMTFEEEQIEMEGETVNILTGTGVGDE